MTPPKNDADRRAEPKPEGRGEPPLRGLKRQSGGVETGARHVSATELEATELERDARAARKTAALFDQTGTGALRVEAETRRRLAGLPSERHRGLANRVCHKFWPGSNMG